MSDGSETAFLQHFPREYRGRNGHFFYHAVRSGADDPRKVCSLVYKQVVARLKEAGLGDVQRLSFLDLKRWLEDDRQGAMLLAHYCLEWEQATPEERRARKERNAAEAKREAMGERPPTEKQLALLKKLGHTGEVHHRAHASELIEKLKTW